MEIREETEGQIQSELKLWVNDKDKIYLEVGPVDNEDAPYHMGFITLTKDDAHALMDELFRLIKGIESQNYDDGPLILTDEPEDSIPEKTSKGKGQLTLMPPSPDAGTGQIQFPSKVNWQK